MTMRARGLSLLAGSVSLTSDHSLRVLQTVPIIPAARHSILELVAAPEGVPASYTKRVDYQQVMAEVAPGLRADNVRYEQERLRIPPFSTCPSCPRPSLRRTLPPPGFNTVPDRPLSLCASPPGL